MTDQERLLHLIQSHLESLVSEVSGTVSVDFDSSAPFGELGVDSFRVLKIIKALEADFGTLPKTLLFENFTVNDLARYFVREHAQTLCARFAKELRGGAAAVDAGTQTLKAGESVHEGPAQAARLSRPAVQAARETGLPILLPEKEAFAHPELREPLREIFDRHKNEGSVSRGTRSIAPHLFIGSERKGFFHYSRSKNLMLAYAYTGPEDYFPALAGELYRHCDRQRLELNILADREITDIGGISFSCTPFGALQRILNLQSFTLEGAAMRRLRYQVSRFQKAGKCRTLEYRCGSDPQIDRDIAAIIDQWCAARTMVNPLIHIVKEEILAGTLSPEHRIFITSVDEVLQNAILISPLCKEENGYLMDLEFYSPTMPLGGLEFAIVRMIETLAAEGCSVLSLGGTYGCKLQSSANADPDVDRILDQLRLQNIFNDEGNLQFKNKFRPENRSVFLCRPVGRCTPDNVTDIIMMIADPMSMQTSDAENQGLPADASTRVVPSSLDERARISAVQQLVLKEGDTRFSTLAEFHFNPLNIPPDQIEIDLKTDSWAQLKLPAIDNRMRHLRALLQQPADLDEGLRAIFPFAHFVVTTSGRAAEGVFYRALSTHGVVLQNLLFPTAIFHQIDKGFTPRELPVPEVFQLGSQELYKGNLDLTALRMQLATDAGSVGLVCIELSDNAAGGYPVSLAHLTQLKAALSGRGIPLAMDATRVLENALFIIEHEKEHAGRSVWEVVREILSFADVVLVSLAKDFCFKGGLIATNDTGLFQRLQSLILEESCGLDVVGRRLLALSIQDRKYIESRTLLRKQATLRIWNALKEQGVPVAQPAGGHCILIDVKEISELRKLECPAASFLAWLYLNTGIRAGKHNAGMQKGTAINDLVRLAVPVGLKREQVDEIIARLTTLFAQRKNIPEIEPADTASGSVGDIHAKYKLIRYHFRSEQPPSLTQSPTQSSAALSQDIRTAASAPNLIISKDIAVVGMAGRYPQARNLRELWANLVQGKDCIEEIPDTRLSQRLHNRFTRKYRGGFIDGVDEFDAGFFNISPRDAQIMDPQERLFLEVACEALEDAGYYPEILGQEEREVGVFVGAVWSTYQMLGVEEKITGNDINPSSFFWSIANRVSYWMNLTGPSLTLDTACSASLTAIHLACEALHSGECSAAIVGGVNLDLHQSKVDINSSGGSLSKDGVCRSFGKGANGYVSGEGVGALFLKRLDRAIADGDNIHGVIKSTVVTHSGRTSGYMVPGPHPQIRLIQKALERGGIDARSIGYIEAHGTGTDLGDSIEVAALTRAFAKYGADKQSCSIGSIKANIGHLEAASGIVGVQKILLQMKHRKLVASLHSGELNESIDFASSPFYVQQTVADWPVKEVDGARLPRRAGITAIGAGGTGAHIILEEYERPEQITQQPQERIFPLSARSQEQLRESAVRLREVLLSGTPQAADDIAHTLQLGRKSFEHRLVVIARTRDELAAKLTCFIEGKAEYDVLHGHVGKATAITHVLTVREKQEFIELLRRSGDPRRLAQLWADGVIPDWRSLPVTQPGRTISLPTYPFAKERHWITNREPLQLALSSTPAAPAARELDPGSSGGAPKKEDAAITIKVTPSLAARHLSLAVEDNATLFVRQMFAGQLRMAADDLDVDCHLMETGITSLDMAQMTQVIKAQLDPDFSPIAFFECTTVRSLCALLARSYPAVFHAMSVTKHTVEQRASPVRLGRRAVLPQIGSVSSEKPLHVQDAESQLALPDLKGLAAAYQDGMHRVLITGATGFLGIHLVAELLSSDPEATAWCLVRASSREHGLQRILSQAKAFELQVDPARIRVLCGDLNEPVLGLTAEDWQLCCRDVQQIIHASAHVNHIEGYATFRDSTRGMKEIIRLACTGTLKLIQFMSSIAGCALKIGEEFSFFEKEDFIAQGEHVYGGYGQSKWVQESLLKRAHESGVPYVIYRFCELSGSSRTGLGQIDDMLHRLLQMKLAVGCREKISNDVLDMLPVDFAAQLIVNTGRSPELWNAIVHATHLKPYTLANLYRIAAAGALQFEPVTRSRFLSKCYDFVRFIYSIDAVNGFVLECVLRDAQGSVRNRKMMDGYFSVIFPFDQSNFRRALRALGLPLPEWTSLIDRYFERWHREDCGFMARIREYQQWSRLDEAQKTALAASTVKAAGKPALHKPNGINAGPALRSGNHCAGERR